MGVYLTVPLLEVVKPAAGAKGQPRYYNTVCLVSPKGEIVAHYQWEGELLKVEIVLPEGLEGSFEWHGATHLLHAGKTTLVLANSASAAAHKL